MLKVRRDLVVSKLFRTFASEPHNSVGDNFKKQFNYGKRSNTKMVTRHRREAWL